MADIPQKIENFIANRIFSVSELEILLFLRDHAKEKCGIERIGKALMMHRPAVEPRLESLRASGLIAATESNRERLFQYAPVPELAALVDELAHWYHSHPVAITTLIFSKPVDKIIRGFAESFRFRPKEDK
jgi:DNA-binding transcriptional ArsR family regulator